MVVAAIVVVVISNSAGIKEILAKKEAKSPQLVAHMFSQRRLSHFLCNLIKEYSKTIDHFDFSFQSFPI